MLGSDLDIALFGKVNRSDPVVQQRIREAIAYAKHVGLGESAKVLDINVWDSEHWMLLDFLNSPNYDPSRGVFPLPKELKLI